MAGSFKDSFNGGLIEGFPNEMTPLIAVSLQVSLHDWLIEDSFNGGLIAGIP